MGIKMGLVGFALLILAASLMADTTANTTIPYGVTEGIAVGKTVKLEKIQLNAYVTDAGSGTGAATYTYVDRTTITICLRNIDAIEKTNVILTDDPSTLPGDVTYIDEPYEKNGKVMWLFPEIEPGEVVEVSYTVDKELSSAEIEGLSTPTVYSEPLKVVIGAPQAVDVGDDVTVELETLKGTPVSNATIHVFSPNGNEIVIVTDNEGKGQFKAEEEGSYRYLVEEFQLTNFAETKSIAITQPLITASIQEEASESEPAMDLVPVVAGIVVISLFILGIMMYFSTKEKALGEEGTAPREALRKEFEEEEAIEKGGEEEAKEETGKEEEISPPEKEAANLEYESAYDFSRLTPVERVKQAREITRKLIEMRRKERRKKVTKPRKKFKTKFEGPKKPRRNSVFRKKRK